CEAALTGLDGGRLVTHGREATQPQDIDSPHSRAVVERARQRFGLAKVVHDAPKLSERIKDGGAIHREVVRLLGPAAAYGEVLEHLQGLFEVGDRLPIRRDRDGAVPRQSEIAQRLFPDLAAAEV